MPLVFSEASLSLIAVDREVQAAQVVVQDLLPALRVVSTRISSREILRAASRIKVPLVSSPADLDLSIQLVRAS
jgi:hypothetical protein